MEHRTSKILQLRDLSPIGKSFKGRSLRSGCSPPNKFTIEDRRQPQIHSPRWKQMIHPQIQSKYNEILFNFQGAAGTGETLQDAKSVAWQKSLLDKLQLSIDDKLQPDNRASHLKYHKKQDEQFLKQKSQILKQEESTFEDWKSFYESKISVLQHQNKNLMEQLFYLREALIRLFEKK